MPADDDDRSLEVRSVAAVFMSVACVAVMLRCYVRGWVVKAFGWDDGAMVFAMVYAPLCCWCEDQLTAIVILYHVFGLHDRRLSVWYRAKI